MPLHDYIKKRNFKKTKEPAGDSKTNEDKTQSIFVIQKHDASHLHYDFRLEVDGMLKSWAVPKGPSLDTKQKRLAMMVEDHPFSYRNFEGKIPEGSYGAGEVIVWDTGTYTVADDSTKKRREEYMTAGLAKGDIKFVLHGQKLNGKFALVKMHVKEENAWLLIKEHDENTVEGPDDFSHISVLSEAQLTRDAGSESDQTRKPTKSDADPPDFFTPMLATLVDKPFTKPGWIYEPKLDGYRALAFINHGEVQLYSRNHVLLNKKFPSIVATLKQLPIQAVIDGEVVGTNEAGEVEFQLLQNADQHPDQIAYSVFDLPFLQGKDITHLPLVDRKKLLKKAVEGLSNIKFVEDTSDGEKLFEMATSNGLEGIIAKKADSIYQPGVRGDDWLKIKIIHQQDAIICGYTKPSGSRQHFGSLLLGVYQDQVLHYIGHTGTGFPTQELTSLKQKMDKLKTDHPPFSDPIDSTMKDVTWLRPELVCEVKYAQWTKDHLLRQAVYFHLRSDKDPLTVIAEKPEETTMALAHTSKTKKSTSETVHFSHPDKIYWPKLGLTKKDLLEYYTVVGPTILPYLHDRPESLNRFPNGVDEPSFFQKDITFDVPDFVKLVTIKSDDVGDTRYMVCNNLETLLYMANLGCIEINPWNSHLKSLDCPDYLVIDLDPLDVPFTKVVDVAKGVKKILDKAKVSAYCKTSGKKGLHIFIPLHGRYQTDVVATFAKLVASLAHQQLPEITSIERSPTLRQGKVYVDFLQNRKGQTIAAPYSLRPVPEATVSTPLDWSELTSALDPKKFTIKTLPKRLADRGDIWQDMLSQKNDLKKALELLQKSIK